MSRKKERKIESKRLNDSILAAGLTGKTLSERTGISEETISRYRTGKGDGGAGKFYLQKIAEGVGVSEAYLLGDSDFKTEREEKIATLLRVANSAVVKKSTVYKLLSLSGYELIAVFSPFFNREEDEAEANNTIADFIEATGGGELVSDSGVTYEFINPAGKTVYVPVENFMEAEELIEDFAKMTFRHLFDNWGGVQSNIDSPPKGQRRAVET